MWGDAVAVDVVDVVVMADAAVYRLPDSDLAMIFDCHY